MKDISRNDIRDNLRLTCRKDYDRQIRIGDVLVGSEKPVIMAGPCTVEGKSQIFETAHAVKQAGAQILRGGVFKPLTFPYGDPLARSDRDESSIKTMDSEILDKKQLFRNAEKRLSYLKEAGAEYGLPVVSEILYADSLKMMLPYVDLFQIGYRSMFNMDLLHALCDTEKPVLIKRHYGESLRSLLGVAEHFEARGKHNFILCERGIAVPHTHNVESRAILDVQAIPALKEYAPSVPVIADPSHSTFKRRYVAPVARAAIAAGADGLLVDVHHDPPNAWVDPLQALGFDDFEKLMFEINAIAAIVRKDSHANIL